MNYTTREGIVYDITQFSPREQELLDWLKKEAQDAKSWTSFDQRTAHGVISHVQSVYEGDWQNHPMYVIQKDLLAIVGIRQGELTDKLNQGN